MPAPAYWLAGHCCTFACALAPHDGSLTLQALKEEQRAVSGALRSLSKEMQVDGEAVTAYREVRAWLCSPLEGLQSRSAE